MNYLPSFRLEGRKALVTGAGRGIGRAIAVGYAEAGADVALVARTREQLEETAALVRAAGREALVIPADIRDADAVSAAVKTASEWAGRVDILVNNAGMNIRTPALEVTEDEWETIMQTNLKSAFLFSQTAGRHMKEQGGGRIVSIASVAGHVALRTGVVYGATKAALMHMTRILALEWGKYGINVNALGPWYFKTSLTEKLLADPDFVGDIVARTPLRRIGELPELVGPAVFLASDAAAYVTGQTLMVDGGMTIYGF
ncbi:2-deoxy-D-gluconate 3-dehydrogenase [Gordoniibacillus kamchatkensis]|uniref:2-deoxy-D-gluconate 3-dehydrogenase n=1 Tax=Gordoniibacillus kamchatkensis TaxID=1590651 RepID=A0ABR5AGQ7_9BACL|nr:glucose 1-dehydrogenase [Paenibacillus sp. VKM B-2647]KIL40211.1 2-deoxy-D-gluconate 3-dehydrogenase [Paenibacillus sp. VKM B-2647]